MPIKKLPGMLTTYSADARDKEALRQLVDTANEANAATMTKPIGYLDAQRQEDVITIARALSPLAILRLVKTMESGTNDNAKVKAAIAILDRAWGQPSRAGEVKASSDQPIINIVFPDHVMQQAQTVATTAQLTTTETDDEN